MKSVRLATVLICFIYPDSIKCLECQEALGMKYGSITDEQISASSEWDSNHAAIQGRLDFRAIRKSGSWSARINNRNQWLQVDLRSQHATVTGVATQGRSDNNQWVVRYILYYSNNGRYFRFYRVSSKIT